MSQPPDPELIQVIAADLGVDPAFVEKDWYAVRLAALVAGVTNQEVYPVFSGGTCLSKAYGLIQRFSEDLDFKFASPPEGLSRGQRRTLRNRIVAAVRHDPAFTLRDADIHPGDESRFVRCNVTYRDAPATPDDLRPHLQLEVTFSPPAEPVEPRPVSSFVAQARREAPEIAAIACVSLVETAADKLSALIWRVLTRQRNAPDDDPTLIRHLHDLAALEATVIGNPAFPPLFLRTAAEDAGRGSLPEALRVLGTSERLQRLLELLAEDAAYRSEYDRFVLSMSYARTGETPSFDAARESLQRLASLLHAPE